MQESTKRESATSGNLFRYMMNPRAFTLKKWLLDMLKDKYAQHDNIVERISVSLTTDRDLEDFAKLMLQVYECAYMKAVSDYKSQAEKLGLNISIVDPS